MKPLIGVELKRFLRQFKRENKPDREARIFLQSVAYPFNVGAIFRLADGAGVNELILSGITPRPPHPTIAKVGRHKDRKIAWRYERDGRSALGRLKEDGHQLVALELVESALPYHQFQFGPKVCLVVGNEDHGVSRATLDLCEAAVFVPMFGRGRSHNVNTALAIVLYHVLLGSTPARNNSALDSQ